MIKNRKKLYFSFFIILLQSVSWNSFCKSEKEDKNEKEEAKLLNRIILSINKIEYTQRDLEIYLLVKKISEKKESEYPITAESWKFFLAEFSIDFIIYQTAQEIAFYRKTKNQRKELKILLEELKKSRKIHKTIESYFSKIKPSQNELSAAFFSYQIIQDYIKRKKNKKYENLYSSKKPSWLIALQEESPIRFYKKAKIYEAINSLEEN